MTNNENSKGYGTTVATGREVYEAKVAMEAFERAGYNKNLHGHVHEVLYKDALNANPQNVLTGAKATLTKSTTAVRDDIVVKQGGKVVKRFQLKDTAQSINYTVKQVQNKHYQGTNLMGTKETVKAYEAAVSKARTPVTQTMKSTNISSNDTKRIAAQVIGKGLPNGAVMQAAKSSGVAGAVLGGGIEVISSGVKLLDGEIDGEEFVTNVAKETVSSGLSAAGGTAAATVAAAGAASVLAATAAPVWVPAAVGVGAAVAVGSAIKSCVDEFFSWF